MFWSLLAPKSTGMARREVSSQDRTATIEPCGLSLEHKYKWPNLQPLRKQKPNSSR